MGKRRPARRRQLRDITRRQHLKSLLHGLGFAAFQRRIRPHIRDDKRPRPLPRLPILPLRRSRHPLPLHPPLMVRMVHAQHHCWNGGARSFLGCRVSEERGGATNELATIRGAHKKSHDLPPGLLAPPADQTHIVPRLRWERSLICLTSDRLLRSGSALNERASRSTLEIPSRHALTKSVWTAMQRPHAVDGRLAALPSASVTNVPVKSGVSCDLHSLLSALLDSYGKGRYCTYDRVLRWRSVRRRWKVSMHPVAEAEAWVVDARI